MPQLRVSKTNEQNALLRYKLNFDLNAARSIHHLPMEAVKDGTEGGEGGEGGGRQCGRIMEKRNREKFALYSCHDK